MCEYVLHQLCAPDADIQNAVEMKTVCLLPTNATKHAITLVVKKRVVTLVLLLLVMHSLPQPIIIVNYFTMYGCKNIVPHEIIPHMV